MKPGHERPLSMSSALLSSEEHQVLLALLGPKCQSLSTSVIQLFLTEGPDHSQWKRRDAGVLCFVKDHIKRSHFLRLYCLGRKALVWENEVYNKMEYRAPREWLHTFEADSCMAAFNFADEGEARHFKQVVTEKLEAKKQRAERRSRSSLNNHQALSHQGSVPNIPSATSNGPGGYKHQRSISSGAGSKKKIKDPKRRLTKADIGLPKDFRHVSHVGWDPNKGFDGHGDVLEDPNLKSFFQKAGVSEVQLKDRRTREFIYDFINTHGGLSAVKDDVTARAPPVPSRAPPSHPAATKPAPPQPPSAQYKPPNSIGNHQRIAPPPPPPPPATYPSRPVSDESRQAPAPPPPPPPPMTSQSNSNTTSEGGGGEVDTRAALMAAIKSGKALKHVDVEKRSSGDSRGELLDQIKRGVELKAVTQNEKPSGGTAPMDGLAGALARALADRNRAFHDTDSESESEAEGADSDSDWEE